VHNVLCIQPVYYSTELTRSAMQMTFNLSEKLLRCVATVAHSNFTDVSSSVVIAFNECQLQNVSTTRLIRIG